ncbi:uncharacterized protein LOC117342786 [Pecten maximus]|uniref:uncharacterized protein LOC117342786 n=1 Tax=Pecten maximus TaxID=6579 RepID=UPI0014584EFC|nr:uncharacterized protein LOC117342786 [Pecten maximus]
MDAIMDLNVTSAVQFGDYTLSVFIYPTAATGVIFHYRSEDFVQHFVLWIAGGILSMEIYEGDTVVSKGAMDQPSIFVKNWYFVALIVQHMNNIELQIQRKSAPQTKSFGVKQSHTLPLNVPGQIRIGAMFERGQNQGPAPSDFVSNFQGQMICVQMYNLRFPTAYYDSALDQCNNANFPSVVLLPATPAPIITTTPRTICAHFDRRDLVFTRVQENSRLLSSINDLDTIVNTSLRRCAVYCVRNQKCVSFTVTKTAEDDKTCRLYPVYNTVYVTASSKTDLYVINVCT